MPALGRAAYGRVEIACSIPCIVEFIRFFEKEFTKAWGDPIEYPSSTTPQRNVCESCLRPREGAEGWRRLGIQLSGENGFEAFTAETSDSESFLGEVPSVCSVECGIALLRACAKQIIEKNVDRATEDREFANPHKTRKR
jgi:hypothetical protein